jgi:hypothetical protein
MIKKNNNKKKPKEEGEGLDRMKRYLLEKQELPSQKMTEIKSDPSKLTSILLSKLNLTHPLF